MRLEITSHVGQAACATDSPVQTGFGPREEKRPSRIPDDDSALAVIRNFYHDVNFRTDRSAAGGRLTTTLRQRIQQFATSFSESLSRYRELSEKVSGGRFSPDGLREQVEQMKESLAESGADSSGAVAKRDSIGAFSASTRSGLAAKGLMDARALAWLRDEAQRASLSQNNIDPARVLHLLKGNTRG